MYIKLDGKGYSYQFAIRLVQLALEQFRSIVNRFAILSNWKNCSILKSRSISSPEMLREHLTTCLCQINLFLPFGKTAFLIC